MSKDRAKSLASEQESRAVAEAAREKKWEGRSFARGIFDGRLEVDAVHPPPRPDPDEEERGQAFLRDLEEFVRNEIDGDEIDRTGHVPEAVLDGLAELGAFGIKIPREYGGLGLSQSTYGKALALVASECGATSAYLSAHQSIGVPQPLTLFGTEEQKQKYLPRLAEGALSAFALTEPDVGSDPANLSTTAEPTEDGTHYILNGEKLWTTNGPRAELMVVMARTPAKEGSKRKPISAFIVESDWEGVETSHECDFMGIRGISNGVIRFTDVKVPAENLLWKEGRGLKLALITLNTGRLSLPAICAGGGKACTAISRSWAAERVQWGAAIGKHDAIAQKIGSMAAHTFAMEASVELAARMADAKTFDIRLEAAMAKLWHSERAWEIADDMIQIRGGRGYETAQSLAARGEAPVPAERVLRDMRINRIFEGSSEIMHLFIAREAVDSHLKVAGDMVDPRASFGARLKSAIKAGLHYAWWYPTRWLGWSFWPRYSEFGELAKHLRWAERTSRRLARNLFHAMVRFGAGLEKKQAVLARLVDVGADLFVMTATVIHAHDLKKSDDGPENAVELADLFCRQAKRRIKDNFRHLFRNDDARTYKLAQKVTGGEFDWLERGIVDLARFEKPMVATAPERGSEDESREPVRPETQERKEPAGGTV